MSMNAFYEHHKNNIRFQYRCFDRILLNGLIQPFQQEKRMVGFFGSYRDVYPVSRDVLREIATQFHNWVINRSKKWGAPILDAPEGRRDEFVQPYFKAAKPDQVVCVLKAREPARIITAIGNKKENRWHLELKATMGRSIQLLHQRRRLGPHLCADLPVLAVLGSGLPEPTSLDCQSFNPTRNSFPAIHQCLSQLFRSSRPATHRRFADSAGSLCGRKWLTQLIPFFTPRERQQAGVDHRLLFSQVELCDNLIFSRRAAVDRLSQRLMDANRTIGQPNKLTVIFGRKISRYHAGKLQTVIEDLDLPNPVIRSYYKNGFIKQYVRDKANLRTEPATNNVTDYGVGKAIENLPELRDKLSVIIDRYHNVQQDILESFVDRGQLLKLTQPTILSNGKRVPGLKLDHPRQLALMQALVRFSHLAAQDSFSTAEVHADTASALGRTTADYTLASLRYDLSKLRAKGLVDRLHKSRRYRLTSEGYRICVVYLKLFEKIYAPLASAILKPFKPDSQLQGTRISLLDRLYRTVVSALDLLVDAVGIKVA